MKKMKSVFASLAVGAVLVTGAVAAAPSANAALCGYPPVECPTSQTNPDAPQRVGGVPGTTLVSETVAQNTAPTSARARSAIGDAVKVEVAPREAVKIRTVVNANEVYRIKVKHNGGGYSDVGVQLSGSNGRLIVPTLRFTQSGDYTIAIISSSGETFYVKIVVG